MAEKEADVEKEEEGEGAEAGAKKKKLIIYILAGLIGVVVLIGAVIGTAYIVSNSVRDKAVGKAKQSSEQGGVWVPPYETFPLTKEPINFTLKPDEKGKSKVIVIGMEIAFEDKTLSDELLKRKSQLMDILVTYFGTKTPEDVSADKVPAVKQALINAFTSVINSKKYKIKDIFFTTYIIS